MIVRLINPRGRVVEIDDHERDIKQLIQNGFSLAPNGEEAGKIYNPVFDLGQGIKPITKDTREEKAGVSGDVLRVIKI
jgi:hypothetical protein